MKRAPSQCENMDEIREEIDQIDRELIAALKRRADYIDRAAQIKSETGLPARINERVEEVIENVRSAARSHAFSPDLAERIWREMIEWSIAREEDILTSQG